MAAVETTIVVDAPARDVYELAKDQERFPEFMPDVASVAILERDGARVISRWKTLVEEAPIEWIEEDLFDDAALRVDYRLLEGDLDKFEGSWTFEDGDGRTHVTLLVDFDFGAPQESARKRRDDAGRAETGGRTPSRAAASLGRTGRDAVPVPRSADDLSKTIPA
jgi:coenzyme Q-binding protein COQ10